MSQAAPYPAPDCLVELDVHADVRGPHVLRCKLLDLLDSLRGTFFEGNLVQPLVKVDRVFPCDSILHTAFLVHHLRNQILTWDRARRRRQSSTRSGLAAVADPYATAHKRSPHVCVPCRDCS